MKTINGVPDGWRGWRARAGRGSTLSLLVGAVAFAPALVFAQTTDGGVGTTGSSFTQLHALIDTIVNVLQYSGVAVVSLAIVWAGYKMIFQHARWTDVATVVLGALLIGGASVIATWLFAGFSGTTGSY